MGSVNGWVCSVAATGHAALTFSHPPAFNPLYHHPALLNALFMTAPSLECVDLVYTKGSRHATIPAHAVRI
jgi:hypothetical protein